jgi:hypothetical protein
VLLLVLNDRLDLGDRRACSRSEAIVLARDEGAADRPPATWLELLVNGDSA